MKELRPSGLYTLASGELDDFLPLRDVGERKVMQISNIERQILAALARGHQSKEISVQVGRSRATVETHVRLLFA
jgi:DNA-binding NarL/FixJ family response regulator